MTARRQSDIAPRGKSFAVVRLNHVVGGKVLPVVVESGWKSRVDANRFCGNVDERLSPAVVLVDELRAEERS
jgi:hypothetical protein